MAWTQQGLMHDLRRLGVSQGMALNVHSSLRAVGAIEGGAHALVAALLEAVGETGTLMMPTFPKAADCATFSVEHTPSSTGVLTEVFRTEFPSVRSLDPWHPFSALGADADEVARDHLHATTLGENSPLDKLVRLGGHVLQIGTRHNTNTLVHLAEVLCKMPYIKRRDEGPYAQTARMTLPDGRVVIKEPLRMTGCSTGFVKLTQLLDDSVCRTDRIGNAPSMLTPAREIFDRCVARLETDRHFFLCDSPDCEYCRWARAQQ